MKSAAELVGLAVDILKACRAQPRTRGELACELGIKIKSIDLWASEMVAQGLLVEADAIKAGRIRRILKLAPEWGGA